jgi:hypothetical protein
VFTFLINNILIFFHIYPYMFGKQACLLIL